MNVNYREARRRTFAVSLAMLALTCVAMASSAFAAEDLRLAAKQALPATVSVQWRLSEGTDSTAGKSTDISMSSGTVISSNGMIATLLPPSHRDARQIDVSFGDGKSHPANLWAYDRRHGICLLKIKSTGSLRATDLAHLPVPAADSDLEIGQPVLTAFFEASKDRIVASGIVVALNRTLEGLPPALIQLDVGTGIMSGGAPVLDLQGRLVGIIAARRAGESKDAKVAYVYPIKRVRTLVGRLFDGDSTGAAIEIKRGYLGIKMAQSDPNQEVVVEPLADSPAAAGGILPGDKLLAIDGKTVSTPVEVMGALAEYKQNDRVALRVRRNGEEKSIDVKLGDYPESMYRADATRNAAADGLTAQPNAVVAKPGKVFIMGTDGKYREYPVDATSPRDPATVRNLYEQAFQAQLQKGIVITEKGPGDYQVVSPTIQVQRSDVEKKLAQLSRDVQALREQVQKLTEELKELRTNGSLDRKK